MKTVRLQREEVMLFSFGQWLPYVVEYIPSGFAQVRLHRLWPKHCFMAKIGRGELTDGQTRNIVEALENTLRLKSAKYEVQGEESCPTE